MGKKIVKYRYIILIAFVVILGVSAAFLPTMIEKVNYDLTSYLPDDYETSKGYEFLSDNFNIHGDVEIGLTATRPQIEKAAEDILAIEGVTNTVWAKYFEMLLEFGVYDASDADFAHLYSILTNAPLPTQDGDGKLVFDETTSYNWALLVTLRYPPSSQEAIKVFGQITDILNDTVGEGNFATAGMTEQANALFETVFDELWIYLIVAGIVVVIILALTTNSLMEPIILLLTLGISIVINLGTNAIFPSTSMITFAVTAILQLGLSMDYAIFLLHQYRDELKLNCDPGQALAAAIPKSAKAVTSSALTTVVGFLALMCMQFEIGTDLGLSLAKGILCSLATVVLLQPCFMLMLDKARVKTQHKCLDFHFRAPVKRSIRDRRWVVAVFALLFIPVLYAANFTLSYNYVKFMPDPDTSGYTEEQLWNYTTAKELGNQVMIIVPNCITEDGETRYLIEENYAFVNKLDELGAELAEVNGESVEKLSYKLGLYVMIPEGSTIKFGTLELTLSQLFRFMDFYPEVDMSRITEVGYIDTLLGQINTIMRDTDGDGVADNDITLTANDLMGLFLSTGGDFESYLGMFQSYVNGGYTMYTVGINPAINYESQESFDILDEVKALANGIFGETGMRCYFTGYTQGAYDFAAVTPGDYAMVTAISIAAILVILILTLSSFKFSVLLVALIEFGIWLNLLMQYIFTGGTINFMSYLVITAVQLGATVDYAILIATKFRSFRKRFVPSQAAYIATTDSVMSVCTSALIMAGACFSIFAVSSNLVIQEMTFLIARGALISAILVIFVLPALLTFADRANGREMYIPMTPKLRPYRFKRRKKYIPQLTEPAPVQDTQGQDADAAAPPTA